MKKLLILIFLSISLTGYSQFVFKNGKSTARIDTIATNGNFFYWINRTTNQICQAQIRNQALVVQNIYTFTDSLTTLRAFRDSINALKLTLSTKFDYGDTVSILETQYHAEQTYLKITDTISIHNQTALKLNASDTTSKVETRHHAVQTYLGKLDKAVNSELLAGKDSTYIKANWGGGSTITASDGVYMDGTTVKFNGIKENDYQLGTENSGLFGDSTYLTIVAQTGDSLSRINVYPEQINLDILPTQTFTAPVNLIYDRSGLHYDAVNKPDTAQTTPLHLMTEAQTKREINATDGGWRKRADATKYYGESLGDSIVFYKTGNIYKIYRSGICINTMTSKGIIEQWAAWEYPNTMMGYTCGQSITPDAALNSGYGNNALQLLTTGSSNTAIGTGTLNQITTQFGNTAIGGGSLTASIGNRNIGFGASSGYHLTTESFRLVINSISRANKNEDTTKSIIYGLQDATVANQKLYLNANVNVAEHLSYKGTYASIFRHKSLGDTTQSIPTGTTPTKVLAFSTNGQQSNCTADKTNDKITITKTGRYMVNLSLSYASGTNAVNWTAYIFNGGVECENIHSTGYTATANDKRSTMLSGIINVTSVPADIDYRVTHGSGAAVDLIFTYLNLSVNYIGD